MADIKTEGGNKKSILEAYKNEYETVKDNKYSDELYKSKTAIDKDISIELNNIRKCLYK